MQVAALLASAFAPPHRHQPLLAAPAPHRRHQSMMKAPARLFQLSDWYGDDWDVKKPLGDELWVSPWAKAHYKLRQQEIEVRFSWSLLSRYSRTPDACPRDTPRAD